MNGFSFFRKCSTILTTCKFQKRTNMRSKTCFIVTPIGAEQSETRRRADGVIEEVITPILNRKGFEPIVPHKMSDPGAIDIQVIKHILESDLVIVNLTGLNSNVMYELAVRHSFGKPVVCIAEDGTPRPFDVQSQRILYYKNDMLGATELKEKLPEYIDEALKKNPLNPIINAQSDLSASKNATTVEKLIMDKLDFLIENTHSNIKETVNSYRKVRPNGTTTFYICTASEAKLRGLYARGYHLVVSNNKFLDGIEKD